MVVGDMINGITAVAGYGYFVPAGSNEFVILAAGSQAMNLGYSNAGADHASTSIVATAGINIFNIKIFVDNTIFLEWYVNSYPVAFSGIQTK